MLKDVSDSLGTFVIICLTTPNQTVCYIKIKTENSDL